MVDRIINKEVEVDMVYEDDKCIAWHNVVP